jgi:hypothetical protein
VLMNVGAIYQIATAMPAIQMSFFCFGFMVTLLTRDYAREHQPSER